MVHAVNKAALRPPAILVLTGASGSGKTTLTLKLNELAIPGTGVSRNSLIREWIVGQRICVPGRCVEVIDHRYY